MTLAARISVPARSTTPDDEEEVVPPSDHVEEPEPYVFANRAVGVAVAKEGVGRRSGRQQQRHHQGDARCAEEDIGWPAHPALDSA